MRERPYQLRSKGGIEIPLDSSCTTSANTNRAAAAVPKKSARKSRKRAPLQNLRFGRADTVWNVRMVIKFVYAESFAEISPDHFLAVLTKPKPKIRTIVASIPLDDRCLTYRPIAAISYELLPSTSSSSIIYIHYCATAPDHQRRGVSSELISYSLRQPLWKRIPVFLYSAEGSEAFYERFGFVRASKSNLSVPTSVRNKLVRLKYVVLLVREPIDTTNWKKREKQERNNEDIDDDGNEEDKEMADEERANAMTGVEDRKTVDEEDGKIADTEICFILDSTMDEGCDVKGKENGIMELFKTAVQDACAQEIPNSETDEHPAAATDTCTQDEDETTGGAISELANTEPLEIGDSLENPIDASIVAKEGGVHGDG